MKRKFLSVFLAFSLAFTAAFGSVGVFAEDIAIEAYTVNDETYNFRDTTDLEASVELNTTGDQVITLTWPAVDKEGNPIKANPLRSLMLDGTECRNPMGSFTYPYQGMVINYKGWNVAGNNTKPTVTNTGDEEILMGLTSTPTQYPMAIVDGATNKTELSSAYLSDDVVCSGGFATAYVIEYSRDGVNFTQDHIASSVNHGKKLAHRQEDGTFVLDSATTYFLKDQFVEEMTATLEPDTEYTIRVRATSAANTTENYRTFETKVTTPAQSEKTPAFPTVEGGGTYSQGGRGGDVYVVTNLTDSVSDPQPGSLRYGLLRKDRTDGNTLAPRTIVFAVGGTIHIDENATKAERRMNVTSNTTILGQTAPGEGITVAGASMKFSGDNIIVRYMHFRLGGGYDQDAATATGRYIVIDHCSFGWGVDEVFSAKEILNSSIQYNIISSGLAMPSKNGALNTDPEVASGESEAKHGMGSILNGYEVSYTHNLWAHNGTRNPRFEGGFDYNGVRYENKIDYANNVIYDWGHNSTYGGERGKGEMNITGNYYKPGPETLEKVKYQFFDCYASGDYKGSYYIADNVMTSSESVTANNAEGFNGSYTALTAPVELTVPYAATSADEAYNAVINGAGASLHRDPQDQRLINEVKNGTGAFINSEAEAGGWDSTTFASAITDSDNDGLPDDFETNFGLNPNDAGDSCKIVEDETSPYNGYSYIEIYACNLVGDWGADSVTAENSQNVAAPDAQIVGIIDGNGNDVKPETGNAILISGNTYTVKLSEAANAVVYLNDKAVSDDKLSFTVNETGIYNLSCLMEADGYRSYTAAVPVTVVKGTDNLEGFTSADIGAVGAAGADNYDAETGILYSQGAGRIGTTNTSGSQNPDIFHYNYRQISGDFEFTAKMDNLAKIDYLQKSGIMVRASLDQSSEFYMAALTYIKGEDYEGTTDVSGESVKAKNIMSISRGAGASSILQSKFLGIPAVREGSTPNYGYGRITRAGNTITVSASLDGENWYTLREFADVTLPDTCYIGFATSAAQDTSEKVRYNATAFSEININENFVEGILGDANCDGNITANDAALTLQYVLSHDASLMTAQGLKNIMVIDETTLTANNAAHILQKALNNGYRFPVEG